MDDLVFLSRLQFAITSVYHFFFVPLTIGLGLFIAIWETLAYKSGNSEDERIVRFWGRLFLLNFAVGVVTGIVQEFQFGMNWSEYSRFVGDVFGAPLAIEALLAFFMESTFLGLWMFGRNVLPRGVHLTCIWLVFAASCVSAVWILIANSFMQHPVGYVLNNGRAEMTDFFALITNPYFLHQIPHVISASICTAAFFVLGISAWKMLQNTEDAFLFERTFRYALFMGFIGLIAVLLSGHLQGQSIAKLQPMKLAAMENLEKTSDPAPLSLVPGLEIPAMLSFMVHNRPSGEVQGLEDLQKTFEYRYGEGNYTPPVWVSYISFRVMVGASSIMMLFIIYGISWHLFMKKNIHRKIMFLMLLGISLPYIANSAGWILAEMGRQPWIVYGLMPTDKAISVGTSSNSIIFSITAFTFIYGALAAIIFILMRREVLRGCKSKKPTRKTAAVKV
ncbi:MAG: cytochrome ubiquinol oxidase subunit I [Fibromonadaceae bacterium]|jgi:cytochrome d ubiquinol oxidase subunit I|nr:cytochrome ubiquinol oxidase subunit I [Fibromonadaceae bacterium]